MAYTNQKAVSSYILLQIKPKLPGTKTESCRFPDVTGGMDSGFSSCAAPAFCCGPGISRDRWVYARERAAGRLLGRRMRRENFRRRKRKNSGVERVKQFPEAENCEAENSSRMDGE